MIDYGLLGALGNWGCVLGFSSKKSGFEKILKNSNFNHQHFALRSASIIVS